MNSQFPILGTGEWDGDRDRDRESGVGSWEREFYRGETEIGTGTECRDWEWDLELGKRNSLPAGSPPLKLILILIRKKQHSHRQEDCYHPSGI